MVDVGKELLCALDFTFLQGTFLQGEVSLPRRGRKPEGLGVGAPAPAPNAVVTAFESRRENGKASELRSEAFSLAPPTGLEPVTLRLTVECSAN